MNGPVEPAFRHQGEQVTRQRFYEVACDPRRHVVVEACAGAGKTWMLVSRILRALLASGPDGCRPEEILAITFTRKAAGEMRLRLDQWLEQFAAAEPARLQHELRERGLDAGAAQSAAPRLKNLFRELLDDGRTVQIRTFHGWFASLLRLAPLELLAQLGLPAEYQLLQEDEPARAQVWRPFFEVVHADADVAADYRALVATHGRSQIAKALDEALQRRIEFALADLAGDVGRHVAHFADCHPACAGGDDPSHWLLTERAQRLALVAAARELARASQKSFAACGEQLAQALDANDIRAVQAALLTQKSTPRKFNATLAAHPDIARAQQIALDHCAAQAQHDAWLYQQRMTRLTRKLIAVYADLKRRRGWVDMADVEAAARTLLVDPALSGWLQERLDARIRHLLIDEFQDTNPIQWQALQGWLGSYAGAGGDGPRLFIVGDPKQSIYRFRRAEPQVFVAAQGFVTEALGGDRLTCDHTHRNARAVIELVNTAMVEAQGAGEFEGFRAHTSEVDVVGRVLALPLIEQRAAEPAAGLGANAHSVPSATATKLAGTDHGVEALTDDAPVSGDGLPPWRDSLTTPRLLPEDSLATLECRQVAWWIAGRIAEGVVPSEIMVLSRRRYRLTMLNDELRALHIAVQQPEKTDLRDAPAVQDLIALLDVLVSNGHDLSLARALRSPLFGFSDDELVQVAMVQRQAATQSVVPGLSATATRAASAPSSPTSRSWFALLQRPSLPSRLAAAGACLLRWREWVRRLPPHDALAAIFADGDVLARFAAMAPAPLRDGVLAQLNGLLAVSLQYQGARFVSPYALIRAVRAGGLRAPATTEAQAVRLLTVHGAKGLEADHVVLLDCDAKPPKAVSMGVLVVWPGADPAPRRFVFLASEKRPSACATDDLRIERAARRREEINALYVAATRARATLVLSGVQGKMPAGNASNAGNAGDTSEHGDHTEDGDESTPMASWWQRLSPYCQSISPGPYESGAASSHGRGVAAVQQADRSFSLRQWPLAVRETAVVPETLGGVVASMPSHDPQAAAFGQALHRLLEWSRPGRPFDAAQIASVRRTFKLAAAQAAAAAAMAARIRAGDASWIWDADAIDWQGDELAMAYGGQTVRLDRLVRHRATGIWWVIDYKAGFAAHRERANFHQLQLYREAVAAALPGQSVRAAFLTGDARLVALDDAFD